MQNNDDHSPEQSSSQLTSFVDPESDEHLEKMAAVEKVRSHRVAGVRTVLVILSARGMVFDTDSLRQQILLAYPDAAVFFMTTLGKAVGAVPPHQVDLLIDFTGPGQRQGLFVSRKFRRMARTAVGRNAGLFRNRIYDRVFDEKSKSGDLPGDLLARERFVQKAVLELAGIALLPMGGALPDRSKSIARELPPMLKL